MSNLFWKSILVMIYSRAWSCNAPSAYSVPAPYVTAYFSLSLFSSCLCSLLPMSPMFTAGLFDFLSNQTKIEPFLLCLFFACVPLRPLNRLRCQQALLDQLGQRHYQQVQSGRQRAWSAGDSEKGVSQRQRSGRDGWVELVTSVSDRRWGLVRECGRIMCLTS